MIISELKASKKRLVVPIRSDISSTTVDEVAEAFRESLTEHPAEAWKTIYIDLRYARVIDSKGLNWLFNEVKQLQGRDKQVVLQVASPAMNRVIQFSGLDKLVTMKFRRRRQTR